MSAPTPNHTHYLELGFGLVHIPPDTKGPRTNGWQDHPIVSAEEAAHVWKNGGGLGLHHAASGTAVLDIDHPEWAVLALAAVDIDLEALLSAPGPKIRGAKGLKPVYRLPEGMTLTRHALAWQEPGAPKAVTVLELRTGKTQDVLPPSIHPDTGKPYTWEPDLPLTRDEIPELPGGLLALWQHWTQLKPVMDKAQPWAAPPPPRTYKEGGGVIGAFNERYTVHDALEQKGYKKESADRYLSPHSSSGLAGVVILKGEDGQGRVYCHHASDPLSGEHSHDAFSVWLTLEHGGDMKAVVKEAAEKLDMSYSGAERVNVQAAQALKSSATPASETDATPEEPWAEMQALPDLHPPVPPLPPELLPAPLRPWLADIAERTSLPLEFVAAPALVALGAVIGRGVGIHPKRYDDWLVVPNIWGGIVGRPGVMKTTAISEATKPLKALAAQARERYQAEATQVEAERARLELEISALKETAKQDAKKRNK